MASAHISARPIARLFTRHPASVGETYVQHLLTATAFGVRMIVGGLACIVHALLPFMFERTGSRCIDELHERMIVNRCSRQRASQSERS